MGLERFSAFIPYDVFTVETPYSPEEIAERVQSLIAERPVIDLKELVKSAIPFRDIKTPPLLGNAGTQTFEVHPKPRGRRSFTPHFYGVITPTPNGSIVKIRVQLHPMLLLGVWAITSYLVFVFINIFSVVLSGSREATTWLLAMVIFMFFMYGFSTANFYEEANPAKKELLRVLAPQNETPVEPA